METERSGLVKNQRPFVELLKELGVTATLTSSRTNAPESAPASMRLTRGRSTAHYELIYDLRRPTSRGLGSGRADRLLLMQPYVGMVTADLLRGGGVQYIDLSGNAWIEFGDVLIDVRGRRRVAAASDTVAPARNLFAPRSAQVVMALLTWPELWGATRREVAHAAGVSVGQAQGTLTALSDYGYWRNHADRDRGSLLDVWAASVPAGLARRLLLARYHGEPDAVRKTDPEARLFLSGAAAAPGLRGASELVLYVAEADPRLPIVNRWRTDGPPNIEVRQAFWNSPRHDDGPLAGLRDAPWPLVYADLLASEDPRVRAEAQGVQEAHAATALG